MPYVTSSDRTTSVTTERNNGNQNTPQWDKIQIREDNLDRIITTDNYAARLAYLTTKIVNNMENYMKPPGKRSTQQIIYHVGTLYPKRYNYKLNRYVTMYINRCL